MAQTAPLVVVVGETASGKSELAMRLAEECNGELICADSSTVRKQADIGTAKPSKTEQARVPHHLLDIVEPDAEFSAAQFKQLAQAAIEDIATRGKLPILVGGTGLYIDAVLYNYEFRDAPVDSSQRERLSTMSVGELQEEARALGLELHTIDIDNPHRLIRFIETGGQTASKKPLRENTLVLGLQPDRETLNERIEKRVDTMLEQGLEDEVRQLAKRYDWQAPALKSIGYAEWQSYLDGRAELKDVRAAIVKNTKDLAKRQRTWFKRNKSIHWHSNPVKWEELVASVTTFLAQ